MRTLNAIAAGIRRTVGRIQPRDRYDLNGNVIVHHYAWLRQEQIPVEGIESWSAFPEMIFDVVCIRMNDGTEAVLCDDDGNLQDILSRTLRKQTGWEPQREVDEPRSETDGVL